MNNYNFTIQIQGELNKAAQTKIQKQLNQIGKNAKVKFDIDTARLDEGVKKFTAIETSLSNIRTEISLVNKGIGRTEQTTAKWNQATGELESIQTKMITNYDQIAAAAKRAEQSQLATSKRISSAQYTEFWKKELDAIDQKVAAKKTEANLNREYLNQQIEAGKKTISLNERIAATDEQNIALAKRKIIASKEITNNLGKVTSSTTRYAGENGKLIDVTREWNEEAGKMLIKSTKVTQGLDDMGKKGKFFSQSIGDAAKKFLEWTLISTVLFGTVRAIKAGVEAVTELNSALIELRKVSDLSQRDMGAFTQQASAMGETVAASTTDIVKATADFARMGFGSQESLQLGTMANMFVNIGDGIENVDQASKAIIATLKGFNMEASETMHVLDAINEVSNNFSVDSAGLASGIQRVSASMSAANNTFEETLGLFTAVNEVTQNAERSSTGLRTIAMRMRGMDDAGQDLVGLMPKLQSQFSAIGIEMMDSNDTFKSTYDLLGELAEKWDGLSDAQQAALTYSIAGIRRSEILEAALSNYKTAVEATETALNSQGSALKENEIAMESIENRVKLFKKAVDDLWINAIDSGLITSIVNLGTFIIKLIDKIGLLNIALVAIGIAFKGLIGGGVGFAIAGIIAIFDAMSVSLKEQKKIVQDLTTEVNKLQSEYNNLEASENRTAEQEVYLGQLKTELWLKQEILKLAQQETAEKSIEGDFWSQVLEAVLKYGVIGGNVTDVPTKFLASASDKIIAYRNEIKALEDEYKNMTAMYPPLEEAQRNSMNEEGIRAYNEKLSESREIRKELLTLLQQASDVSKQYSKDILLTEDEVTEAEQKAMGYFDFLTDQMMRMSEMSSLPGDQKDSPESDDGSSSGSFFDSLEEGGMGAATEGWYELTAAIDENNEVTVTQAEIIEYLKENYAELAAEGFDFAAAQAEIGSNIDLTNEAMQHQAGQAQEALSNLEGLAEVQRYINEEQLEGNNAYEYAIKNQERLAKLGVNTQKVLLKEQKLQGAIAAANLKNTAQYIKNKVKMLGADEAMRQASMGGWSKLESFLAKAYTIDAGNWMKLELFKGDNEAELIEYLKRQWAKYYQVQLAEAISMLEYGEGIRDETIIAAADKRIEDLEKANRDMANLTVEDVSTVLKGMGSAGGATKDMADDVGELNEELEDTVKWLDEIEKAFNIRISNLDKLIERKKDELDAEKELNELQKEKIELERLYQQLTRAKEDKMIHLYTGKGATGWEWVADRDEIEDIQDKIDDKLDRKKEAENNQEIAMLEAEKKAIEDMIDAYGLLDDEVKDNINSWDELIKALKEAGIAFSGGAADIVGGLIGNQGILDPGIDLDTVDTSGVTSPYLSLGADITALNNLIAAISNNASQGGSGQTIEYNFGDITIMAENLEDFLDQLQQLAISGEGI